ncbi:MAG: trypsin-like peptidase domain-containing protein [Clostridia bacterium]|nr:trypsin-like peptidase domain-containing protein [Clostridia bacterium]
MKKTKYIALIILCIIGCLMLISCGNNKKETYKVSFYHEDGTLYERVEVTEGDTVSMPKDPYKTNHVFLGWYSSKVYGQKYDFSQKVTGNLSLYARYEISATDITNEISRNTMKSIVTIRMRSYNTVDLWILGEYETESTGWSQGSGFCYEAHDGYYFIMTNCHVAVKEPGYKYTEYEIIDYKGNKYTGYLYKNPSKSSSAIDPEYDLACLYFKSSSTEVAPLEILKTNPKLNDDAILLGTPGSQTNSITFGKVREYTTITLNNLEAYSSNVTFDVIRHDAGTKGGSSGGPLLNSDLKVIGVNYAGQSGGGPRGYAIPAERVWEFLYKYVYD